MFLIIKGINLSKFNSIIIQTEIQFVDANVKIVLVTIMTNAISIDGVVMTQVNNIRMWRNRTPK